MIAPPDRPLDDDAERGLLSCLCKGDVFAVALDEGVNEATFANPLHQELWKSMVSVDNAKELINEVSVLQRLGVKRIEALGKDKVWFVFNSCDTSGHVEHFCKMAREAERLRKVQNLALVMLDGVANRRSSVEVVEGADKTLFGMNAQRNSTMQGMEVEKAAWEDFLETKKAGGKNGHATGLQELDFLLAGGLRRRTLTVLAARPSMGKTALALQIGAFMMRTKAVYFQSLEMNAGALGKRLIGHLSQVPIRVIEEGKEDNLQHKAVEEARRELREGKLHLNDKGGASMALCRALARRVKDVELIVIDYCGLVTASDPRLKREQQIAGISKDAKLLAEEMDCPVMLLSQLNRSSEQLSREPRLSDLRESGALEQDADNVMLLHQPVMEDRETISLLLAKNRFGGTGRITLVFDRTTQTFKKRDTSFIEGARKPFIS